MRAPIAVLSLVGLCVASAPSARGLDPSRSLTQYMLDVWTQRVGDPWGTITAIAQTPDGFLWLGTDADGLYRFDGVRFVRDSGFERLYGRGGYRVNALATDGQGELWAGTQFGLAHLREGRWRVEAQGYDAVDLAFTRGGELLLAARDQGLIRWRGGRVEATPLPTDAMRVAAGPDGEVWVASARELMRVRGRSLSRRAIRDSLGNAAVINALYVDSGGDLRVGTRDGLIHLRGDRIVARQRRRDGLPSDDITAVFQDRAGSFWLGTGADGLARLQAQGRRVESFGRAQGLSNSSVTAFYEDREGSLWIATRAGLSRLRVGNLIPFGPAEGLAHDRAVSIVRGREGSLWIWTDGGDLSQMKDGRARNFTTRDGLASNFGGPLFEARDGSIWVGHDRGVSRVKAGQVTAYRSGLIGYGYVPFFAEDEQGLLTFVFGRGLVHFRDGRVVAYQPKEFAPGDGTTLDRFPMPFAACPGRDGTLWLATVKGAWTLREGVLKRVWTLPADRLSLVAWIYQADDAAVWLATWEGLYRLKDGAVAAITVEQGLPHNRITHILEDRLGYFWLSSPRGIFRVLRKDLDDVADGRRARVTPEVFGMAEGMRSPESAGAAQPAGCAASDGRLWFATSAGVVVVDPARLQRNALPPRVFVEDVLIDGRSRGTDPEIGIPAGATRIEIQYTAPSLLVPEKVRFKYRLDGFDPGWVDAGARRMASYTKLPPGSYTLHVTAANNDGVWSEGGASVRLRQQPRFYQMRWFVPVVALLLVAGAVAGHRVRVHRHVRAERELQARVQDALAHIKTLRGLLPICAWCKKVRDDSGYWSQIEVYLRDHTQAEFSHGICPECRAKQYPGSTEKPRASTPA